MTSDAYKAFSCVKLIGATQLADMSSVMVARQMFVMYARTNMIQAIDCVYTNIKDTNTLRQQCEQGDCCMQALGVNETINSHCRSTMGIHWQTSNPSITSRYCSRMFHTVRKAATMGKNAC